MKGNNTKVFTHILLSIFSIAEKIYAVIFWRHWL